MKKFLSIILAGLLCVPTFLFVGCTESEKRDDSKTQLDISYFAGGFGETWINQAKTEFEEKYKDFSFEEGKLGVQIWIDPNKSATDTLSANIQAGTNLRDLYLTAGGTALRGLIKKDLIEDITDVYKAKPDGENGKTIEEKLLQQKNFLSVYGNGVDKYYALPYTQAIIGFVFDYDLFVQREWLNFAKASDTTALDEQGFTYTQSTTNYGTSVLVMENYSGTEKITYEKGDAILTAGKDGKFGTHDDGQPQNIDEWNNMVQLIYATEGTKPFIFARSQPDYMNPLAEAIFAQYDGIENFEITYDYDGTYTKPSTGEETPITLETGYKTFEFEGREIALKFLEDNLGVEDYMHPSSDKLSRSAIDIQSDYVLGYRATALNPLSAILVEGIWWENEARGLFNSLAEAGEKDRAYGARDYRYMLYPAFENQKGIDGNGNGTVFSSFEDGNMFIRKGAKDGAKVAAKRFIEFITTDDWLAKFTIMTGGMRPFDYTLTAEQYDGLTSFQQHTWNIYHDSENYKVVMPTLMQYAQPINYASSATVHRWGTKIGNFSYNAVITGLLANASTAAKYYAGMTEVYSAQMWSNLVSSIM